MKRIRLEMCVIPSQAVVYANVSGNKRERRYEPRERARIQTLERSIARERALKEAEERDRVEMRSRLDIWDDDESDELFYTDRYVSTIAQFISLS